MWVLSSLLSMVLKPQPCRAPASPLTLLEHSDDGKGGWLL